jgi:hypothetical protein
MAVVFAVAFLFRVFSPKIARQVPNLSKPHYGISLQTAEKSVFLPWRERRALALRKIQQIQGL